MCSLRTLQFCLSQKVARSEFQSVLPPAKIKIHKSLHRKLIARRTRYFCSILFISLFIINAIALLTSLDANPLNDCYHSPQIVAGQMGKLAAIMNLTFGQMDYARLFLERQKPIFMRLRFTFTFPV